MGTRSDVQHGSVRRSRHRDPFAGVAGAAPARSAVTLRVVLAAIGLVAFVAITLVGVVVAAPVWLIVLSVVIALTALLDLIVLVGRKARGE
jgi:hypothetical protein